MCQSLELYSTVVLDRFLTSVIPGENPDDCWDWTGLLSKESQKYVSYGLVYNGGADYAIIKAQGKTYRASKVSLEIKLGRHIFDGLQTCHTCPSRCCCNPRHLYEGTQQQNTLDRIRENPYNGESNPGAILSEVAVAEIRSLYKGKYLHPNTREIGEMFGVSSTQVWRIINGKRWNGESRHE